MLFQLPTRETGITPACAGKSRKQLSHPSTLQGSPPRVRGKAVDAAVYRGRWKDHPRVCGEKNSLQHPAPLCFGITPACAGKRIHYSIQHHCALGSPPRVRGKGGAADVDKHALGITPACAGKSLFVLRPVEGGGDHPRVCGEKTSRLSFTATSRGSPPRVRGKGL